MQIWLAEDEAPQREHLAALLRQVCAARGVACELRAFEDGQALVDAYAPGVDLLLLDIDMPGLSGMDAAHRIREWDERVLIVFCTNLVARALDGYAVAARFACFSASRWRLRSPRSASARACRAWCSTSCCTLPPWR